MYVFIIFKVLTQFLISISVDIKLTVHLRAHVLYKEVNVCVCVYVCGRISWVLIRNPTSLKSCYIKGLLNGTLK